MELLACQSTQGGDSTSKPNLDLRGAVLGPASNLYVSLRMTEKHAGTDRLHLAGTANGRSRHATWDNRNLPDLRA